MCVHTDGNVDYINTSFTIYWILAMETILQSVIYTNWTYPNLKKTNI